MVFWYWIQKPNNRYRFPKWYCDRRHESACLDSCPASFLTTKSTFVSDEPNPKKKKWCQYLKSRFCHYMVLQILFLISLILLFYKIQSVSKQNDELLEMIFKLQSQVHKLGKKSEHKNHRFENREEIELSTSDAQGRTKPPIPINPVISKEEFQFNAADFLNGASVDMDHSSSSNLNPLIGYDQTNLVLLDRPQPPTDKAWCSNDENPILTINLAKYIKPISVSYQHSKWHGTIPNGAPRTYDVVACLDYNCEILESLVSNCGYKSYESGAQEQICNINPHQNVSSIGKVQFRFRENYGNTEMTCVHLVRVYGETKTPVKTETKNLKSEEICTDLKLYYHTSSMKYNWANKNCTVLYENECCTECPECCNECLITDYNSNTFDNIILYTILVIVIAIVLFFAILTVFAILFSCVPCLIGRDQL